MSSSSTTPKSSKTLSELCRNAHANTNQSSQKELYDKYLPYAFSVSVGASSILYYVGAFPGPQQPWILGLAVLSTTVATVAGSAAFYGTWFAPVHEALPRLSLNAAGSLTFVAAISYVALARSINALEENDPVSQQNLAARATIGNFWALTFGATVLSTLVLHYTQNHLVTQSQGIPEEPTKTAPRHADEAPKTAPQHADEAPKSIETLPQAAITCAADLVSVFNSSICSKSRELKICSNSIYDLPDSTTAYRERACDLLAPNSSYDPKSTAEVNASDQFFCKTPKVVPGLCPLSGFHTEVIGVHVINSLVEEGAEGF